MNYGLGMALGVTKVLSSAEILKEDGVPVGKAMYLEATLSLELSNAEVVS